jgi:hypothetical protein
MDIRLNLGMLCNLLTVPSTHQCSFSPVLEIRTIFIKTWNVGFFSPLSSAKHQDSPV